MLTCIVCVCFIHLWLCRNLSRLKFTVYTVLQHIQCGNKHLELPGMWAWSSPALRTIFLQVTPGIWWHPSLKLWCLSSHPVQIYLEQKGNKLKHNNTTFCEDPLSCLYCTHTYSMYICTVYIMCRMHCKQIGTLHKGEAVFICTATLIYSYSSSIFFVEQGRLSVVKSVLGVFTKSPFSTLLSHWYCSLAAYLHLRWPY